ncbi:MAG: hypothetical protein ACTSYF_02060, partial [Promethearchaeota archaeon]
MSSIKKWLENFNKKISKLFYQSKYDIIKPITYHERLICCKLKNKEAFEFVKKKLIYIGFKDITTREFFGKRGSDLMLEYILPGSIFRIHLRAYIISDRVFFLIHKEPIVSKNVNDLYFHLRGFIERFSQDINKYFSFPSG